MFSSLYIKFSFFVQSQFKCKKLRTNTNYILCFIGPIHYRIDIDPFITMQFEMISSMQTAVLCLLERAESKIHIKNNSFIKKCAKAMKRKTKKGVIP